MSDLFWLPDEQMARLQPFFPRSHGRPRVDDHRVLSGIIFINRNGLRWRDAPREYGPAKTLYNRWKRWSDKGVFVAMMDGLSAKGAERKTTMIDATYLKAHRTASSLGIEKGYELNINLQTRPALRYSAPRAVPNVLTTDRQNSIRLEQIAGDSLWVTSARSSPTRLVGITSSLRGFSAFEQPSGQRTCELCRHIPRNSS